MTDQARPMDELSRAACMVWRFGLRNIPQHDLRTMVAFDKVMQTVGRMVPEEDRAAVAAYVADVQAGRR